jgi:hypothetical protein
MAEALQGKLLSGCSKSKQSAFDMIIPYCLVQRNRASVVDGFVLITSRRNVKEGDKIAVKTMVKISMDWMFLHNTSPWMTTVF